MKSFQESPIQGSSFNKTFAVFVVAAIPVVHTPAEVAICPKVLGAIVHLARVEVAPPVAVACPADQILDQGPRV